MRADIRKAVFDSKDIPEERVTLPKAWGAAEVLVRGLTAGELADWANASANKPAKFQQAELIIAQVRDPDTGEPVFDKADRDELTRKSGTAFTELLAHCHRLNGMIPDKAAADLKADGAAGATN